MADNVTANAGAGGATFASDDIGGVQYPRAKMTWGADGASSDVSAAAPLPVVQTGTLNVGTVTAVTAISNALPAGTNNIGDVDVLTLPALAAGTNNIGDVDVLTVPSDPFGANADAASATGSISAKLRFIASTGIPITGTVTVGSHAVTNAGTFAVQVSTELPAGTQNIGDVDIASIAAGNNNIGDVDIASIAAGTNNIGDVDVLTVPADPFGANADAASATGSISAKLRFIASTGIPITGTVTVGSHAVTNAGTFAVQVDGAALTALQLIDNTVLVDDNAFTPATSSVNVAGFFADESATDSVDEGDAGAARMTLDRKLIVTAQPHTAGGLTIHRSIDLDEGALEVVKASPGCLYGMWVTNTATATRWIKFYDATSGTYGTGTPVITIGIPGNTSDDIAGSLGPGGLGITFATGICVGAGTGVADADTGAPGANDVIVNIFYK